MLNDEAFYTKTCDGAFVAVQNFKDKVYISQDFIGCWGLYLFRNGDYWVVSNSFLYLVEYLKTRFALTFNKQYFDHFLLYAFRAFSNTETPVKEIEMLPRNISIIIDKNSGKFEIFKIKTDEGVFPLSEKEGITALDRWFLKWTHFIKNFCPKIDYKIQTDLSGGFESRMVLMLFLCSGIDVNKIRVNSANDNLHCHSEDFEIASMIANHFGFKLNAKSIDIPRKKFPINDTIDISFYTKLGFHKEMYWKYHWTEDPYYCFTGAGANLKDDHVLDFDKKMFFEDCEKKQKNLNIPYDFCTGLKKSLDLAEQGLVDRYGSVEGKLFGRYLYVEGGNRHHYGKSMAESWFSNKIDFTPITDVLVQKLKFNYDFPNLIPAVMFTRYCPDLLNFKFEGKRFIDQKTLDFAKEINEKFPFKPEDYSENFDDFKIIFEKNVFKYSINPCKLGEPLDWCKKVYDSQFVKSNFYKFFPKCVYDYAEKYRQTHNFFPLSEIYAVIAIAKIAYDCEINLGLEKRNGFDFLNAMAGLPVDEIDGERKNYTIEQVGTAFNFLHTARLDIKLENSAIPNSDIALKVVSPKEKCKVSTPQWFSKNGTGYVVECSDYEMELKAKCKNDGVLKFFLRAKDVRNNGERIPVFIDYENLEINEKKMLEKTTPFAHDKPFKYEMPVSEGDEIKISLSWNAHKYADGESEEILRKILER